MAHSCKECLYGQQKDGSPHFGCYQDGKWRKWVAKKDVDVPNACEGFKYPLEFVATPVVSAAPELMVDHLRIHKWERMTNRLGEFSCDYWDCGRKVRTGEHYYCELYPEGHTMSFCVDCASFFMAQALNTLVDREADTLKEGK